MDPVPPVKTPLAQAQVRDAFSTAYAALVGNPPRPATLSLLVAHSALETGWWRQTWNYNLGNVKAAASELHTFYPCGENLPEARGKELLAEDPAHVSLKRQYVNTAGQSIYVLDFTPPHRICRFRAYLTLEAAASEHLAFLKGRFPKSWIALHTDDAKTYATTLRSEGYYTAEAAQYAQSLQDVLAMVAQGPTWGPAKAPGETASEWYARAVTSLAEPPQPNKDRLTALAKLGGETNPGPEAARATNCATIHRWLFALGKVPHKLVGISYQAAAAIDPGGPISWLRAIAIAKGALFRVKGDNWKQIKPGCLLRYNTAGTNDDHMECALSAPNPVTGVYLHGGGGRSGNAVTIGTGDVRWSLGRPLVEWFDTDRIGMPLVPAIELPKDETPAPPATPAPEPQVEPTPATPAPTPAPPPKRPEPQGPAGEPMPVVEPDPPTGDVPAQVPRPFALILAAALVSLLGVVGAAIAGLFEKC